MKKILYPDAADITAGGNGSPATQQSSSKQLNTDMDFLSVSESVRDAWAGDESITLVWKTQLQFADDVSAYRNVLTGRQSIGSNRQSQTQTLKQLDKQIDSAVKEVKVYIERKFKKDNATANFPRYGIVKERKTYQLPTDRDARKEALALMIAATTADGFPTEEFGTAFWITMQTDYTNALKAAQDTDKDVSDGVAGKNQLKASIRKTLTALRFVLRGNYPDTYQSVYRTWGWQAEDY